MKAAFFDVDGTLVEGSLGVLFVKHLTDKGIFPKEKWSLMIDTLKKYLTGKIDYLKMQEILINAWTLGLYGLKQKTIINEAKIFIQNYNGLFKKALEIIQLFKSKNYLIILISTTPNEILEQFRNKINADVSCGTIINTKNGIYNGKLKNKVLLKNGKQTTLKKISKEYDINLIDSYAFGDTIHDAPMLSLVGNPITLNPKGKLIKKAIKNNWKTFTGTKALLDHVKNISKL